MLLFEVWLAVGLLAGAEGVSGNVILFGPLAEAAAAAAAATAAASWFDELVSVFPFRKVALLMNGENPLRSMSWAAAAADGGKDDAAITDDGGQKPAAAAAEDI